jgi:hypothetical protein
VEEELSPTHLNTYLSTPLKTHFKLKKLYTTTTYIKLEKFTTSHIKLQKFDTNMLHIKLKKFNTINIHIKLKKFDPTTPHIKQKKFNTNTPHTKLKKPSTIMMLFLLLEDQLQRVFLLPHIGQVPRRFFPLLLFHSSSQDTTKRMMLKVMWKPPMSIFKYNLTIIYLTLPSHILQYRLHAQLTAIPSPSSYLL